MHFKNLLRTIIGISILCAFSFVRNASAIDESIDDLADQLATKTTLSHSLTFCRSNKGKVIAQYADTLQLANDCEFQLNSKKANTYAKRMSDFSSKDGFKSHVSVGSVYIYDIDDKIHTKRRNFTASLGFPDAKSTSNNLPIDWVSNASKSSTDSDFFRIKSKQPSGHSEPQFISDFEALWIKDSTSVIKQFTPQTKKEKENIESVVMCGLELHGSFDMCDTCLNKLRIFRCNHQKGQTSISKAIRDELKSTFKGSKEDAFVIAYHGWYPYKESTYKAEEEGEDSDLHELNHTFSYNRGSREDSFARRIKNGDDTYTLSHIKTGETEADMIYAHMHFLSGRKSKYDTTRKAFVF